MSRYGAKRLHLQSAGLTVAKRPFRVPCQQVRGEPLCQTLHLLEPFSGVALVPTDWEGEHKGHRELAQGSLRQAVQVGYGKGSLFKLEGRLI